MITFEHDIIVDTFIFDGRKNTGEYSRCHKLAIAYRDDASEKDIFTLALEKAFVYCEANEMQLLSICKLEKR